MIEGFWMSCENYFAGGNLRLGLWFFADFKFVKIFFV